MFQLEFTSIYQNFYNINLVRFPYLYFINISLFLYSIIQLFNSMIHLLLRVRQEQMRSASHEVLPWGEACGQKDTLLPSIGSLDRSTDGARVASRIARLLELSGGVGQCQWHWRTRTGQDPIYITGAGRDRCERMSQGNLLQGYNCE